MITKRILTLKSKLGFGKYGENTVQRLIDCDCSAYLRCAYYHFEEIDFNDEVKAAIGIFEEIPKPGVDREAYWRNEHQIWDKEREEMGDLEYMKKVAQRRRFTRASKGAQKESDFWGSRMSKGSLQAVNHGKTFIKGR